MGQKTRKTKTSKSERKSSKKSPQTGQSLILMGKGAYAALKPIGGNTGGKR